MKNNYINENSKYISKILSDLLKIYYEIEKKNKKNCEENLIGLLFHELVHFLLNKKIFNKKEIIYKNIKFGKRNDKYIYELKQNSFFNQILYNFYSKIFSLFNYKKKIFLGKSIPLSTIDKISLIIFSIFNGYKIVILKNDDIKITISENSKKFFFKKIRNLLIKNKINLKNLNDIKFFINKISSKKKILICKNKNIIITGTLGIFQNRLIAIKKNKLNSKLLTINHIPTYGFVSYASLRYDDFYLCDFYLTPFGKKIKLDKNYVGISKQKYKILSIDNRFSKYVSNNIKKIDFKDLDKKKILYVPARIGGLVLNGKNFLKINDYNKWQDYLADNFGKIDVKYPSKKFYLNKNNKFNILNSKLELIKIAKNYDLILIDSISSSAFSELALTNIPIVYFNINIDMLNSNAEKIIKSRTFEIKVDIFQNYKGFKSIKSLRAIGSKKNLFSNTFYNKENENSFYKNLKFIND